ncbi:hypothetical protein [Streptomyces sp. WAC 00631]|uniref:hypothetical protein n=1 Tax=Streptomyces sp. WAC 00631 TaxID=2203201 RepID=UPI0027DF3DC9|nr:hypothetical protein [Streptomyces sp. WAC 00631]
MPNSTPHPASGLNTHPGSDAVPAPERTPLPKRRRRTGPQFLAPKLQEALAARDALAVALTDAGIQLPAMDVRTPWGDALPDDADEPAEPSRAQRTDEAPAKPAPDDDHHRIPESARYALVHLGVCSAPVALALAAVIARGAVRSDAR